MLDTLRKGILISIVGSICVCSALAVTEPLPPPVQAGNLPVEIFQVLDLPVSVSEALMVDTAKGYVLKVSLSNSTDSEMTGLRYSLVVIDSNNTPLPVASRIEGFRLAPYAMKRFTFKTPIAFKPKGGDRMVLMLEQAVSRESIWDVLNAKEALAAYAKADYSVVPNVLRVANQVDAPHIAPQVLRLPRE